jgi:hypothetical protein
MTAPADLSKLRKLIPLLASDKNGEVVAAAAAITRILHSLKSDWHDLSSRLTAEPPPNGHGPNGQHGSRRRQHSGRHDQQHGHYDWREAQSYCADRPHLLSTRECEFIESLAQWRGTPTEKQLAWLAAIHARLRRSEQ